MGEPQEEAEKKIVSYNNIFSMIVLATWLFQPVGCGCMI